MGTTELTEKIRARVDTILEKHGNTRSPLIQVLHSVQEDVGFISPEIQKYLAQKLEIPQSEIFGVVTFYSFFDMEPQGEHLIQICTGTACYIKGADNLIETVVESYDIDIGETSDDGLITLDTARCMGCCSLAPVATVDGEIYGEMTPDEMSDLLDQLEESEYQADAS